MLDSKQQIYTQHDLPCLIAHTVHTYNALLLKDDQYKLDLDSPEGQDAFRAYINNIESLININQVSTQCRLYRQQYTKAYRVLYSQAELGYIPEIFDAAQEGFTCIWVNGECYVFEPSTIEKGEKLVQSYFQLINLLKKIFSMLKCLNKVTIIPMQLQMQIKERLEEFDLMWITYERTYISQLILIEEQAKKIIVDTVSIQQNLTNYEENQRLKGKIFYHNQSEFHDARKKFCDRIAKLNSIANINGKGRDDLSYEILMAAESVLTKISDSQSKSLRSAAEKIRQSYFKLRDVLKSFAQNIEHVDPQLRNNSDLVEALTEYEIYWEKGKRYFLQKRKQCQILAFSTILEVAKQKYQHFRQLLQYSDPSVFWMIVSVVVLSSLEGQDEGLAQSFIQQIKSTDNKLQQQYKNLHQQYNRWKIKQISHKNYQLYNQLQKNLIGEEGVSTQTTQMAIKIKQFAVNLERVNPADWNDMLSILLNDDV